MADRGVIPDSYEHWRHCIEVLGRIKLTPTYVSERIAALQDDHRGETQEFKRLFGAQHLQQTIAWFRRAAEELS